MGPPPPKKKEKSVSTKSIAAHIRQNVQLASPHLPADPNAYLSHLFAHRRQPHQHNKQHTNTHALKNGKTQKNDGKKKLQPDATICPERENTNGYKPLQQRGKGASRQKGGEGQTHISAKSKSCRRELATWSGRRRLPLLAKKTNKQQNTLKKEKGTAQKQCTQKERQRNSQPAFPCSCLQLPPPKKRRKMST